MGKKVIIIVVTLAILLVVGITAFIFIGVKRMVAQVEKDQEITLSLPANVLEAIEIRNARNFSEDKPVFQKVHFKKYLYLENRICDGGNKSYRYSYNTKMNTKLNTAGNVNATDLDGLVLQSTDFVSVGYYEDDDLLDVFSGKEKEKKRHTTEARRVLFTLTYVQLPGKEVLQRDSVWGSEPPKHIKKNESGIGKFPKDDEVAETILKRIKD